MPEDGLPVAPDPVIRSRGLVPKRRVKRTTTSKAGGTCTEVPSVRNARLALLRDVVTGSATPALVLLGPAQRVVLATASCAAAAGVPLDTLLGAPAAKAFPLLAAGGELSVLERLRVTARARRWRRVPLATAAGTTHWSVEVMPLRGGGQSAFGLLVQLRPAEYPGAAARYRALVEAGALAVWTTGPEGGLQRPEAWSRLTGQTPAESAGDGWLEAVHPADRDRVRQAWRTAVATGAPYAAEYRLRQRGNGFRWTAARAAPVRPQGGGSIVEWVGANTDIHARKMAELGLRASQERFRTLAEAMPHLVWQTDAEGVPDYMNRRMRVFTGRSDKLHQAGKGVAGWLASVHPDDMPPLLAAWQAALSEGAELDTDARLRPAGEGAEWLWFRVRAAPVLDTEGAIRHWVGTCTDIEDRHRAEAAARDALEEQERLARTAEHRVKNSLQLVAALLRLQAGRVAEPAAQEALDAAVARVQAVAEAHRALQRSPDLRSVRVADMLAELACGASVALAGADLRLGPVDPTLMLDADRAVPLTLMLNELVGAALAERRGAVGLTVEDAGEAGITIAVSGLGDWLHSPDHARAGLGDTVVRALSRQIGAVVEARPEETPPRLLIRMKLR
jgi:PAS domain S-box-containing protein